MKNSKVRKANINDLDSLIHFTGEEAREAEQVETLPVTLRNGIKAALEDHSKSIYWVMVDESNKPFGSISALKEWSDWNAGYYWWIQSIYILPEYRGKGFAHLLVDEVKTEMNKENGLELRLYVHKSNKIAIRAYEKIGFKKTDYEIMNI